MLPPEVSVPAASWGKPMTLASHATHAFSMRTAPGLAEAKSRVFVGRCGQEIAERRKRDAAAGNVRHEPRRRGREARLIDTCGDIVEGRGGVPALLRKLRFEALAEDLRPRPITGCALDLVPISECVSERLFPKGSARVCIRLQRSSGIAQPPDLRAQLVNHAIRRAASTAW